MSKQTTLRLKEPSSQTHLINQQQQTIAELFDQLASTYYEGLDLKNSLRYFQDALTAYLNLRSLSDSQQIRVVAIISRICLIAFEMGDYELVETTLQKQEAYINRYPSKANRSRFLLIKGLVDIHFIKKDIPLSETYFNEALELATVEPTSRVLDRMQPKYGIALCHIAREEFAQAGFILNEIYNDPAVQTETAFYCSVITMRGMNLFYQGFHDQGIEMLKKSMQITKANFHWFMYYNAMCNLAYLYRQKGDNEQAKDLLSFLDKTVADTGLTRLTNAVSIMLSNIQKKEYDLKIDIPNRRVIDKDLREIDFGNCFLLLDILLLFVKNSGHVYTKEELVNTIWQESYNPLRHDNKVYYNINRLRSLIEPRDSKAVFILTTKNGYQFNGQFNVEIVEAKQ